MHKEEKLPEESKDSPLNPENTLNPASGDPISTDTTVSKNFSEGVPVSLSSALVDTSSTQSIPHEFKMQKNSEGIFKNSDFKSLCFSFLLRLPCSITSPESVSHWRKCQIEEVDSTPHHCQGQVITDAKITSAVK